MKSVQFGLLLVLVGLIGLIISPDVSISGYADRAVGAVFLNEHSSPNPNPFSNPSALDIASLMMIALGMVFVVIGTVVR